MGRLEDTNGTPVWKWKTQTNKVKLSGLNQNIINYLNELPTEVQDKILATSGNDSGHVKASRHYHNNAVDLSFDQGVWDRIVKDPNRLKYGLTLLDPNHGSGKHIHLSYGAGTENKSDIWMDPHSTKAKDLIAGLPTQEVQPPTTDLPTLPTSTTTTEIIQNGNDRMMAMMKNLMGKIQEDTNNLEYQSILASAEQERIGKERARIEERNLILDNIAQNSLSYTKRKHRPNEMMADGGEIPGIDDNIQFQINTIKAMTPDVDTTKYDSVTGEVNAIKSRLEQNKALYQQMMVAMAAQPNIQVNTTTTNNPSSQGATEVGDNSSEEVEGTANTKRILYEELSTLGLDAIHIAGIIGSLSGESTGNLDPTATGDSGQSYGIAQWHKNRFNDLKTFAKNHNWDYTQGSTQARFLKYELENSMYKYVVPKLKKAKTIEESTEVWTREFERPSAAAYRHSIGKRIQYAKDYYASLAK